ncbi:hypothetical protein [Acinetobacter pittii]|uniref:hypothetical protein n=1 Tax=Acinetobacter pittii TaxID=48296 RepID=UPI0018FF602D|nr:hypothetical protein [Acinetobacter pittii]MBJ9935019.1 hypothetical protein [Acinetobacter pittii]
MALFEVYNDQGIQQVTAINVTFYLKHKVVGRNLPLHPGEDPDPHLAVRRSFFFEAEFPIIALATTSIDKWTYLDGLYRLDGNNWRLDWIDSSSDYRKPTIEQGIDTIVYIYDLRSTADPNNTFGLNLYGPDGKCTYSSNQAPFKVLDTFEVPAMYDDNFYPMLSNVQGRQLAIISNRYRAFYAHNDPSDAFGVIEYYSTGIGQVRVGYEDPNTATFYDPQRNQDGSNDHKPQVIVVDVTNL